MKKNNFDSQLFILIKGLSITIGFPQLVSLSYDMGINVSLSYLRLKSRLISKNTWKSGESTIFLLLKKEVEINIDLSLGYVDRFKIIF